MKLCSELINVMKIWRWLSSQNDDKHANHYYRYKFAKQCPLPLPIILMTKTNIKMSFSLAEQVFIYNLIFYHYNLWMDNMKSCTCHNRSPHQPHAGLFFAHTHTLTSFLLAVSILYCSCLSSVHRHRRCRCGCLVFVSFLCDRFHRTIEHRLWSKTVFGGEARGQPGHALELVC